MKYFSPFIMAMYRLANIVHCLKMNYQLKNNLLFIMSNSLSSLYVHGLNFFDIEVASSM